MTFNRIVLRIKKKRCQGRLAIEDIGLWKVSTLEDKNQQEHFVPQWFNLYKASMDEFKICVKKIQ
jgi:hypothetical protein